MKIIFRFRRRKKSLFSSRLKQRKIVENNVQLSNKELSTLNWKLFGPYFVDNILQFYHETYISYILDDFRQYCPRIEDNIVYFCARQYCPLSKWTYFLGSISVMVVTALTTWEGMFSSLGSFICFDLSRSLYFIISTW